VTEFIRFDRITKYFGHLCVVENLDLGIGKGEFVSLLGPSGSGKTTLLMMLAGFEKPTSGSLLLDGVEINEVPTHRRDMGVVFQSYALFPHMTVGQNIAFPLEMRGTPRAEIATRVARALDMVQLSALRDRWPAQLSGGQQQRVALARALVFEPRVVLMDEPLGALDKQLREQMQLDIRALHHRLGLTIVFVTHDQSEALTMSDRIAVFNIVSAVGGGVAVGGNVLVSVRPERIDLTEERNEAGNCLEAEVADCVYQGDHLRVQLQAGSQTLIAKLGRRAGEHPAGSRLHAAFSPRDCTVIAS